MEQQRAEKDVRVEKWGDVTGSKLAFPAVMERNREPQIPSYTSRAKQTSCKVETKYCESGNVPSLWRRPC